MESSFHPVAYLVLSASRSDLQPHRQFSYRRGLSVIRSAFPCHGQSSQASFLISASACLVNGFCSRSFSFGKDASNLRFRFLISAYLPRPAMLASPDSMVLPLSLSAQLPFPAISSSSFARVRSWARFSMSSHSVSVLAFSISAPAVSRPASACNLHYLISVRNRVLPPFPEQMQISPDRN